MEKTQRTIVVAHTTIDEVVAVETHPPEVVEARVGEMLEVIHRYSIVERSRERDEFRIVLTSSLGDESPPPILRRIGDQWGSPLDLQGILVQTYELSERGEHDLAFEVQAEHVVAGWVSGEVSEWANVKREGTIRVRVQ